MMWPVGVTGYRCAGQFCTIFVNFLWLYNYLKMEKFSPIHIVFRIHGNRTNSSGFHQFIRFEWYWFLSHLQTFYQWTRIFLIIKKYYYIALNSKNLKMFQELKPLLECVCVCSSVYEQMCIHVRRGTNGRSINRYGHLQSSADSGRSITNTFLTTWRGWYLSNSVFILAVSARVVK